MALATVPYELIHSLKNFGFVNPLDRRLQAIDMAPNGEDFIKYECHCAANSLGKDRSDRGIKIILKPFSFDKAVTHSYYIGQCPRCETVYWTQE